MKKLKNFLQPALFALGLLFSGHSAFSQSISPRVFGQNAWMPDTIGNASACQQAPCILYGSLHNKWGKISASGASMIRFGGIAPDRNMPTNYQYIKMIDSIRAKGMEPVIQVPFHNWRYSATQAAAIVNYINVVKGRNIKYWIIGNEPDHEYGYTTANQVSSYIKPFASAMKAVDPSIKIIGPETAWYNTGIINGLTTPGGPDDVTGTDANGRYYIDILSFHCYAFDGTQTRSAMLSKLTSSGGFDANLATLNARIANCNAHHGRSGLNAIKTGVTEANVNYQNAATDNLNGTGVNSFIGGQFVGEMFGIALKNGVDMVNMWSVVEGNTNALNIGYMDGAGNKKPAYYHFQLMSQNFSGNYISSVSTQTNVKVFSCQNSGTTTVMLMNEDLTNNYSYTVRLNNAAIAGASALNVNVNANIAQEHSAVLNNQSTVLLFFNSQGVLYKRIDYNLLNHAALNLAPVVTMISAPVPVTASISVPSNQTSQAAICSGSTATLVATSGTNTTKWYDAATSTAALSTGSVFVTPAISASTTSIVTYYAEAASASTVSVRIPVTMTVNPRPSISVNSGSICAGASFVMSPSGASSYSFSGGNANVSPNATSSYSVTGFSAAGCASSNTAIATVNVISAPVITVNSGAICQGDAFTMVPSGASSYTFSSGSSAVSPASTTSYSVYGSNSIGCVAASPAIAHVTVNARPVVSANSGSICPGQSFTIVPSGASTYTVLNGGLVVSPNASAVYLVTGTDANGCVSTNTASATVNVSSVQAISVNNGTICPGGSFVLNPAGASSYTFSSGSATVSPLVSTSYTVTGSSAAGCAGTGTAIANITVKARPVISVNSGSICSGSAFTIVPSGATTYTVLNAGMVVSPANTSTYQVTGTDAFGCTSGPAISVVSVQALPVISVNSGTICKGNNFTIRASGATSYTYSSGSPVVSPENSTSYTVSGSNGSCIGYAISYVTVSKNGKGCGDEVSVTTGIVQDTVKGAGSDTTSIATGIDTEKANSGKLSVYPNPNNGEFSIETDQDGEFSLISMSGVVVSRSAISAGKTGINVSQLPTGVYIVKISRGEKVQFARILKQ